MKPNLLLLLLTGFYILFTLFPDSSTVILSFPWVFLWYSALNLPIFLLLYQLYKEQKIQPLKNGFDSLIIIAFIALCISSLTSPFPHHAQWYSWLSLGYFSTLYLLYPYTNTSENRLNLWKKQGYLNLAFIAVSLSLWLTQTVLPLWGKNLQFNPNYTLNNLVADLTSLNNRNWAPLGHQNYVAGYLLLSLPLLISLIFLEKGHKKKLWIIGTILNLITLYTTYSKGGWLSLVVLFIGVIILIFWKTNLKRIYKVFLSLSGLSIIIIGIINNPRFNSLFNLLQGKGEGDLPYRIINTAMGWEIGKEHLLTGIGLGNIPLVYQKYRPIWAGRESELSYQLHNTFIQLWAELGLWGIIIIVGFLGCIINTICQYQRINNKNDLILLISISFALLGYGFMSLTDYQLDNFCISSTLVIYTAIFASIGRENLLKNQEISPFKELKNNRKNSYFNFIILSVLIFVLIINFHLYPILKAWQLSSEGFLALKQEKPDYTLFVEKLTQAQKTAPFEPYYSSQLGWILGEIALENKDNSLFNESIKWFELAIKTNPNQEFIHSNLAYLLLSQNNPSLAQKYLQESANLMPAKQGLYYGLGLSLLAQNKLDLAIKAFIVEGLRYPQFMTSPLWRNAPLNSIYHRVISGVITRYQELEKDFPDLKMKRIFLLLWHGEIDQISSLTPDNLWVGIFQGKSVKELLQLAQQESPAVQFLIQAWLDPNNRQVLLQKSWLLVTGNSLPVKIEKDILESMNKTPDFAKWLTLFSPPVEYRKERAGFGVISRHIDGLIPRDYNPITDNLIVSVWMPQILSPFMYYPQFDLALEKDRHFIRESLP